MPYLDTADARCIIPIIAAAPAAHTSGWTRTSTVTAIVVPTACSIMVQE